MKKLTLLACFFFLSTAAHAIDFKKEDDILNCLAYLSIELENPKYTSSMKSSVKDLLGATLLYAKNEGVSMEESAAAVAERVRQEMKRIEMLGWSAWDTSGRKLSESCDRITPELSDYMDERLR